MVCLVWLAVSVKFCNLLRAEVTVREPEPSWLTIASVLFFHLSWNPCLGVTLIAPTKEKPFPAISFSPFPRSTRSHRRWTVRCGCTTPRSGYGWS
uniref:Putative secreted protein n=1 Tax=Anopheles marajoara TaxID=58244 RepID=A0A2M4C9H7_9DIPT